MKLIIGLGNIGSKYVFTRHNVGFMCVDMIAINSDLVFKESAKLKSQMVKFVQNGCDYMLIKPTTYMNLSGEAVRAVIDYYKIQIEDLIVIYDDLSLDIGRLRYRNSGSDGGHNGIKSIIKHLGTNKFARLKIGIGPQPPIPAEAFVLQNFAQTELDVLKPVLGKAAESVFYYFENGIEKTQNIYN